MVTARRKAVIVLLVVFLAGGAAGLLLEDGAEELDWPSLEWQHDGSREADHRDLPDGDAEEDFLESLGLSREQLKAVDRVLERREDRLEEYWTGRIPEIEALIDSSRTEIKALLTPGQREAYDLWAARQRAPAVKP